VLGCVFSGLKHGGRIEAPYPNGPLEQVFYTGRELHATRLDMGPDTSGQEKRAARMPSWVERDAPAARVAARCSCGRGLYFRYAISQMKALIVEDESLDGPAVLRCTGCGELNSACPCVRSG
jgi:hypothetical protein